MSSSSSEASGRSIHSNWMLSFGDLLTLLLCFFLSIISFSPLNPAHKSSEKVDKKQGVTKSKEHEVAPAPAQTVDGTQLANLEGSDEKTTLLANMSVVDGLRLWLQESDYAGLGWELGEGAAARLKSQVVRTAYAPKRVTIESCLESTLIGDETAWAGSISRILSVRSQLIDAGFKPGIFRYRVMGPHCAEIRAGGSGETAEATNAVSRITVEFEKNNG
ncbi:MAG: hypothetical protein J0M12_06495 [Deltaproteobacteria bacterium]|nr:hypothetical protein [Deltaproteobacteria bacterium]